MIRGVDDEDGTLDSIDEYKSFSFTFLATKSDEITTAIRNYRNLDQPYTFLKAKQNNYYAA